MADNEISMEKRVLIAFALSIVVLLITLPLQKKYGPQPPERPKQTAPAPEQQKPSTPAAPQAAEKPAADKAEKDKVPAPGVKQAAQESETVIENDLYRVVFSNRGAVAKSWTLKKYKDKHGRPLEVVYQQAAPVTGYPFMIWVEDEATRNTLASALFQVQPPTGQQAAPSSVVFEYSDGTLYARKEFKLYHESYVADVRSELRNGGTSVPHELAWRGSFGDQTVEQHHLTNVVFGARQDGIERIGESKIKSEDRLGGPFYYGGIEDMFFAAVFMPGTDATGPIPAIRTFRNEYKPDKSEHPLPLAGFSAGGSPENRFRIFVGPKAVDLLRSVYPQPNGAELARRGEPALSLEDLVDYGWFAFIAKPLFIGLKWIYNHIVPNWGWAIVLITIVINMLLFPLKLHSMKSAMKMQKIAPQVKAIQEKYKKLKLSDPKRQQQNQEVMDLYKKHGINPVGGCFPMLLQIPFLYAFYKVLSVSIEMRHAPWFAWVRDLSSKDPYYVLPVLMTGTMFLLQKMTPQTTTDPAQQKMFLYMPLIFGFMFMSVQSGLVLYWLVGNVVGIAQQWYINKTELGAAVSRRPAPVPK